jgi:CRISPR-associated exonuclease Cas4
VRYAEADLLPLSGLQHLACCERQWALIHLEQQWEENRLTAEGRLLHKTVDSGVDETRDGVRMVRSLAVRSFRLGVTGKADVVEFPLDGGPPVPVEYKRGRPKSEPWDEIQLCAQALCLEEMVGRPVTEGAIYYAARRRRTVVEFSAELRQRTEALAARMHELFRGGVTPAPVLTPRCRSCSLIEICQPSAIGQRGSARAFFRRSVAAVSLREKGES